LLGLQVKTVYCY